MCFRTSRTPRSPSSATARTPPYYRRVARELGAEHRVFFTSEVPWTTMPDFYRYADVFVHASLSETYGNVLGEALWCGTPVVAFADGMGVTAQVHDGVNGVLFAPGKGRRCGSGRRRGVRARGRRADSRSAGARAARQGGGAAIARAVLALRRPAAHRRCVPARARSRGRLGPSAGGEPPEDDAVADHASVMPARGRRSTASSTWAATCGPPRW